MINEIILKHNNSKIIRTQKSGRNNFCYLENGEIIPICEIVQKERVLVKCTVCKKYGEITLYTGKSSPLNKKYKCSICIKTGRNNPFFGRRHSKEFKKRLSKERKNVWFVGEKNHQYGKNVWNGYDSERTQEIKNKISKKMTGKNNPFFGKKHSKKTIKKIVQLNKDFQKNLTDEYKNEMSKKLSKAQKEIQKKDPEKYSKNKRKAVFASLKRKKYIINKIESIIFKELKNRKLNFKYSVILDYKQFDFGNKKHKILIEVNGDYWHGNPCFYKEEELNNTQKVIKNKDIYKEKFAKKHGFKLYKIWEHEINNGKYKKIIDKIEKNILKEKNECHLKNTN